MENTEQETDCTLKENQERFFFCETKAHRKLQGKR